MRVVAGVVVAALMTSACTTFMTAGGNAAARWEALEKTRANKQLALAAGDKRICKNMSVMGSNMPQKVCSTQEEWDAFDRQGREGVERIDQIRQSLGTPTEGEAGAGQ